MVNRNKYLFGLIGLAAGFLVSFFLTQSINRSAAVSAPGSPAASAGGAGQPNQQAMMANVSATLEKAKNNPKDFDAQVDAARTFFQIGRIPEATEYLKKAYEIKPDDINVTANIGILYSEQKNFVEAEKWFRRAIEISPDESELYVELGATYIQREPPEPDKAIAEMQRALQIEPRNAHALGHLLEAHLLKKDAQQAEEALARLREADPTSQKISVYQGLIADVKAGRPITVPKE
ncbi:MAG TPA: tetratricopeptide repeat protein [Blastocatellia bacterium]|nr:tetratricopeptide repeat protein [Blastocatellia bacterium]